MSLARIVWAISALAAIILAFVNFEFAGAILAVLGLLSGWFLDHEHRRGVIIAAIFLMMGGSNALNGIPTVGPDVMVPILGALGTVFGAASVMAILRTLVERLLKKSMKPTDL